MNANLRVLFEDNHLLALEKPPGLLTQGDRTGDENLLDLGKAYLKDKYAKPGQVYLAMIHRLDRPTGGVVLFCRTSKAASRLNEQFRERTVKKTYLALCKGQVESRNKQVHYLSYDDSIRRTLVSDTPKNGYKKAILSYQVLARGRASLLRVSLETGRKHQIRAQLAHLGHPLLLDKKYGAGGKGNKLVKAIGLWAHQLTIQHPVKKEPLLFTSWPPVEPASHWSEFSSSFSL